MSKEFYEFVGKGIGALLGISALVIIALVVILTQLTSRLVDKLGGTWWPCLKIWTLRRN